MTLKHCHHCFGIGGIAGKVAFGLTESREVDNADAEDVLVEFRTVDRIGCFVGITEWISGEHDIVLFARMPVVSHTLNHRVEVTLTVKHDSFAVLVSISNSTADEVAFSKNFIRIDFAAEFIFVAAAVQAVGAEFVAAEVIIDLPDAVGVFVVVQFVLCIEEKVIDDQTGTG